MSTSLGDIIDTIHPAASGTGVITTDTISITFDREIDESTLTNNFFVTGPDHDTWIGPDLQLFNEAVSTGSGSDDILESPGFDGLVQGTFSFQRLDPSSDTTISGLDYVGSGFIYRTKAIFTPTNRLQANTEYTTYLTGDEDDSDALTTGISTRTVFDTVASGVNTGTGEVEFDGGYVGSVDDKYHVKITTAGELGTAKFTFTRDSYPSSIFGPFKAKQTGVLLSDGVTAYFSDGDYDLNDEWTVVVKKRSTFVGNLIWPFKTGSGSISTIPTTTSTTVIGDIPNAGTSTIVSTSSSLTTFEVTDTDPDDGDTNVEIVAGETTIKATFSSDIDATTVVSGVDVLVETENVDGVRDTNRALGTLIARPEVSGSELSIYVASGQLKQNNVVKITLDKSIANTDGTTLGSDYSFEYTTEYYPLYCSVRRLRLFIGSFIDSIEDDTINFAIHMASLKADFLTWNSTDIDTDYYNFIRSEWTCCSAAEILLLNAGNRGGQLKSKRLADLQVEYDTSKKDIDDALNRARECILKWEGALMAGGKQVQKPGHVVKGDWDLDHPPVGRTWYQNGPHPISNRRILFNNSRRVRNTYLHRKKGWWNR